LGIIAAVAVAVIVLGVVSGNESAGGGIPAMDKSGTYYRIHDNAAGAYETAGSDRSNGRPCNWVRSTTAPSTIATTIVEGTVERGQHGMVTLQPGEYFVSYGCLPWRHVG
jgi:hypothetical protein